MNSIDEEGKVHFKLPDEDSYEKESLVINVAYSRFQKIKSGQKHEIDRSISSCELENKILLHDNKGNLVVNEKFKGLQKTWKRNDQNNGHFPLS